MSTTLAMVRLANRDPSTQVGNSLQLSAGYSFPDLKQSSGGRNSPCIKLMACGGLLQTTALPYEASYQSNAVNAQADVQIRTEGSALPVNPSLAGGYESKPEPSTGHRRFTTQSVPLLLDAVATNVSQTLSSGSGLDNKHWSMSWAGQ